MRRFALHAMPRILTVLAAGSVSQYAVAFDAQAAINNACITGGSVDLPATLTLTTTLNFKCPTTTGNLPVVVKGAPTYVTCQTAGTPCIVMGVTGSAYNSGENISLRDIVMTGPGWMTAGSEAIRIYESASWSKISDVRIDNFETGMHFIGTTLLQSVFTDKIVIGAPSASTKTAIHLDGVNANIKFTNFQLSAQRQVILDDGPGGMGAGATFDTGQFNSAITPGVPGISVSSTDHNLHALMLSNIEDWETACPYLEIGDAGSVVITGVAWTGNPWGGTGNAAIHILPNTISYLKVSNAVIDPCQTNGELLRNESASSFVAFNNSDLYLGSLNFVNGGQGAFTGNRCTSSTGGSSLIGNLANVRASGNLGNCADR